MSAKSDNSINVETWFNHFKELLTCEPDIDFNFKQMVNNYNDAHTSECPTCIDNEPDELNKSIEISEITDVIKHLQDGKKPGIDDLSYEFFKNCDNNLTTYLCYLFNVILDTGIYPSQWSEAIINPLHKKGSKSDVSNYRGLSLLCTINKFFTKILNTRLMTWAERNGLIDEAQCMSHIAKADLLLIIFLLCTQSSKSTYVGLGADFMLLSLIFRERLTPYHIWYYGIGCCTKVYMEKYLLYLSQCTHN